MRLVLLGGSRNDGDAARVSELKILAKELGIEVRHSPFLSNSEKLSCIAGI